MATPQSASTSGLPAPSYSPPTMPRYTYDFLVSLRGTSGPPPGGFNLPKGVDIEVVSHLPVRSTFSRKDGAPPAAPSADYFSAEDRAKLEEIQRIVRKQLPRVQPVKPAADKATAGNDAPTAGDPAADRPINIPVMKKKKRIEPKVVGPAEADAVPHPSDVLRNVGEALRGPAATRSPGDVHLRELSPPELLGGCLDDDDASDDGRPKPAKTATLSAAEGPKFFQWAPFGPAPFAGGKVDKDDAVNGKSVFADMTNRQGGMPGFDGVNGLGAKGAGAALSAMAGVMGLGTDGRAMKAGKEGNVLDLENDETLGLNPNATPFVTRRDTTDEEGNKMSLSDDEDELTPPWGSDIELPPPPPGGKNKRIETDKWRLRQRQKQIRIGLQTVGYKNFLRAKEIGFTVEVEQPRIPNVYQVCSKRAWDGQIRRWRQLLHKYDELTDVLWSEDEAKQVHQITEKHQKFKEKVRRQQMIDELTRAPQFPLPVYGV